MHTNKTIALLAVPSFAVLASAGAWPPPTVFDAGGADATAIQEAVDAFRAELGDGNRPDPGTVCSGRREINWDAAPDAISAPNSFPGDFFNGPAFPRSRGIELTTPGTGFQLSATAASGVGIEFDNISKELSSIFATFSPERLFTPLGSTVTVGHFFIPGSDIVATTRGFGAVFTDVNRQGSTSIELFDAAGDSLGIWEAPAVPGQSESLSFVGVSFDQPIVASVRIVSGDLPVDGESRDGDLVAMDDFIYGEPVNAEACPSDCPADLTGDGILDLADVNAFVAAFTSQNAAADLDNNGIFDLSDILILVEAYNEGCP